MFELWRVLRTASWAAAGLAVASLAVWLAPSLASFSAWNVLTPFAATLVLVAAPFGLAMARASRKTEGGPAKVSGREMALVFATVAIFSGATSLASQATWQKPGVLFVPAALLACVLGVVALVWAACAAKRPGSKQD